MTLPTRAGVFALVALALASAPGIARAAAPPDEPAPALFALIVGVNASPRADVAPLQYADDDAARYLDLFRALGARASLLARFDDNTRRLHPQAAAEALPPRRADLRQAVAELARDIARSRARGIKSTLYVIYAGHGDVDEAGWHLILEDEHLTGGQLMTDVVARTGADQSHVIVDACQSYLLAMTRGPGGTRRPARGFVELEAAARAGSVGYLLASSASGESHEWAGFEAGVFSHEVRSGLYGAADADGDGRVTYAEIAAFVARANQAIPSDRFRPQLLARAPRGGDLLVDLRSRRDRGLRMEGTEGGAHFLLENGDGVRLLDFHGDGRAPVQLVRPPGSGELYLRRLSDGAERTVPPGDALVPLAHLPVTAPRARSRGAAHQAFSQIFAMPFDQEAVQTWDRDVAVATARFDAREQARETEARHARARQIAGIAALGVGAAAGVGAVLFARSAYALHDDAPTNESQRDTVARNDRIEMRNYAAIGLGVGALAAGATAALLLLWPRPSATTSGAPGLGVAASPTSGLVTGRWRF